MSELLGSFGDNELSPECLDGAQCFLKRNNILKAYTLSIRHSLPCFYLYFPYAADGVMIPSSYTSYLSPISSAKLHLEVTRMKDKDKAYPDANFETPYVVRLHNSNTLAEPQACFTFEHPNHGNCSVLSTWLMILVN